MNESQNRVFYAMLKQRRVEIMMTREHLQKEQRVVDENQEWINQAARQSRVDLLADLDDWYVEEMAQIDAALCRLANGKYGICLACDAPIERQRLDTMPAAAFCAPCEKIREQASNA